MDPGGPAPKLVGGLGSVYAPFPFGTVAYGARAARAPARIMTRSQTWRVGAHTAARHSHVNQQLIFARDRRALIFRSRET